jgi:hypothetical protein
MLIFVLTANYELRVSIEKATYVTTVGTKQKTADCYARRSWGKVPAPVSCTEHANVVVLVFLTINNMAGLSV